MHGPAKETDGQAVAKRVAMMVRQWSRRWRGSTAPAELSSSLEETSSCTVSGGFCDGPELSQSMYFSINSKESRERRQ